MQRCKSHIAFTVFRDYEDYDPDHSVIAMFPGSRSAEIKSLWPAMQKVARRVQRKWPHVRFVTAGRNEETVRQLKEKNLSGLNIEYTTESVAATAAKAHLAMVASGSATLQVASAGCPMVILYQSNPVLWYLAGRWLVKTRFLSLVNILAGRELVDEFMPYFLSVNPIWDRVRMLLLDKRQMVKISKELAALVEPFTRENASQRTAILVSKLLAEKG